MSGENVQLKSLTGVETYTSFSNDEISPDEWPWAERSLRSIVGDNRVVMIIHSYQCCFIDVYIEGVVVIRLPILLLAELTTYVRNNCYSCGAGAGSCPTTISIRLNHAYSCMSV